jgi:uncharacterized membrane protein YqiK
MTKNGNEQFSKQETERRFEAALRGAFKTPPMPMKSMAPKRRKVRQPARKAAKRASA